MKLVEGRGRALNVLSGDGEEGAVKEVQISYRLLDHVAEGWDKVMEKSLSECTCLDCVDSEGPITCEYIFDFYNFDGDCLACK